MSSQNTLKTDEKASGEEEHEAIANIKENAQLIEHFPQLAADNNRPLLPIQEKKREFWQLSLAAGRRTAFVFFITGLLAFFVLLVNHSKLKVSNPVHNIQLKELKNEVSKNISLMERSEDQSYVDEMKRINEELINQIRQLDYDLRVYYFSLKSKEKTGAWILFFSLLGFFMAIRATRYFDPKTPTPQPDEEKGEEQLRERRLGRKA
ncbi:MAG: hypothetical protein HQL32_09255, partial [Planctomycetes bacterium]|nr:hypothetical protein [Planctomycetota bacterium]